MPEKKDELEISREFLLSPEAEPVRRVAESLYPDYLLSQLKQGKQLQAQAIPVLDEEFMLSREGRWARILAETKYANCTMSEENVEHTIVFFGSARITPEQTKNPLHRYYEEARELAKRLTEWSLSKANESSKQPFVIATGGGPAIMEAGNRGAHEAGGKTIGLNITLPMEQKPNPYISPELNFDFHYFFTRKFHFSYRAKALIAFPGGFGTFDELFETLTLIQTKKIAKPCYIYLYGKEFWEKVVDFNYLVETGVISKKDLNLFQICDDVDTAYQFITKNLEETYLTC